MNKDIYYCKYWEHIYHGEYEMCVSDVIYSYNKLMSQIHMLVLRNKNVVRGLTYLHLKKLEETIRKIVRKYFFEEISLQLNSTIKIWYYNIDDSPIIEEDIPLRLCITFSEGYEKISLIKYKEFKEEIYDYLIVFLSEIST